MTTAILTPSEMFSSSVTLIRYAAGSYVDGIWYDGAETESTITASVQPASGDDLMRLPEGMRTVDTVMIYTATTLRTANETNGTKADRIVVSSEEYEVIAVETWTLPNLPHTEAMAVRVQRTGHEVESG